MKKYHLILACVSWCIAIHGQIKAFEHLDVSITAGSTGVGIEVATPVASFLDVRAGFSFMPRIESTKAMTLNDTTMAGGNIQNKFERVSGIFEDVTGYQLSQSVRMNAYTNFYNGKVMLDVRPFQNKHWHFTLGCYFGSSEIVKAKNEPESMGTLLSIGTYNHWYDKLTDPAVASGEKPFIDYNGLKVYDPEAIDEYGLFISYNSINIYLDPIDGYWIEINSEEGSEEEEESGMAFGKDLKSLNDLREGINTLRQNGHLGGNLGKKDGKAYRIMPDEDGTMSATVKVNSLKPYFGFGYEGPLSKKSDKYLIGFDLGAMFWGGVPHFYTHDGTDLTYEVTNYNSQISGYCNFLKKLPVYPVAELRLIRRIDFKK